MSIVQMQCAIAALSWLATLFAVQNTNGAEYDLGSIDRIREVYDSVLVLSESVPGSPFVVAYKRVLQDTTILYHGHLYDVSGKRLLPYTVYRVNVTPSSSCGKQYVYFTTKDYWYGYDMDDETHEWDYLYDAKKADLLDSGIIVPDGEERYFKISRGDKTNVYSQCKGRLLKWSDPLTSTLKEFWVKDDVLRLLVEDAPYKWRILKESKEPLTSIVFSQLNWSTISHYTDDSPRDDNIGYFIDRKWFGEINVKTGELAPVGVLDIGYAQWWFCDQNSSDCIYKMQFQQIENRHPLKKIRQATIMLELKNGKSGRVVYRKSHTLNLNLGIGEIGSSPEFRLASQIWVSDDLQWSATVTDYR